jgi:hypothetical protein
LIKYMKLTLANSARSHHSISFHLKIIMDIAIMP